MADAIRTITPEQILADAELAASYLRTLLAQQIPMTAAVSLTSSYVQTQVLARLNNEKPKDPWEGGP